MNSMQHHEIRGGGPGEWSPQRDPIWEIPLEEVFEPFREIPLKKALADHERWLATLGAAGRRLILEHVTVPPRVDEHTPGGLRLPRADLRRADLRVREARITDLRGADCRGADLRGNTLFMADLAAADLRGADLRHAELVDANLRGADLRGADASSADLRNATLDGADCRGLTLRFASLPLEDSQLAVWRKGARGLPVSDREHLRRLFGRDPRGRSRPSGR